MKKIIKVGLFLLLLIMLYGYVSKILWGVYSPITEFYQEPKNSLDVVYLGPSSAYDYFNTSLAFNEFGFATGMLGSGDMPFPMLKYLIKEAKKYQKPKVYVIDITMIRNDFSSSTLEKIRLVTDTMKYSQNRKDAIDNMLSYKSIDKKEYINYYYSILMYHNNWKNLTKVNFLGDLDYYKGYYLAEVTSKITPQKEYTWSKEMEKLPASAIKELNDLIDLLKDEKLNVIFVIPKRFFTEEENKKLNYAANIISDNGFEILNFNTDKKFIVDYDHDFCDIYHLNAYGAAKYTLYFGKYLKETYDLNDHRLDNGYASYHEAYQSFKVGFKKLLNEDFDKVLNKYKESRYEKNI